MGGSMGTRSSENKRSEESQNRLLGGDYGYVGPIGTDAYPKHATSWTHEKSDRLQAAVDKIFGTGGSSLLGLKFSFTMADPHLEGCPLIGCSSGFTTLCGYEMAEIVGRNCRFLVDPVPESQVDQDMRRRCREFCAAARAGEDYVVPSVEREPWLPEDRPTNELFAVQKNARKDGVLFNNMFYMRILGLGDFDEESVYIVALQSELKGGKADLAQLALHLKQLDQNMAKVERILAKEFVISGSMHRQDISADDDDDDLHLDQDASRMVPSFAKGA